MADKIKVLQFWSGGADSTYLLLQNLRRGYDVTVVYIEIKNNYNKTRREKHAIELLKQDVIKFCKEYGYEFPKYLDDSSININFYNPPKAPQQVTFAAFALLLGRGFDEVHVGVVNEDSSNQAPLWAGFRESYLQTVYFEEDFPIIRCPLEETSKEAIYLTLAGYDKSFGTEFIKHLTCCESEGIDTCQTEFGKDITHYCEPCAKQALIFERLGWIKTKKGKKKNDNHKL